MIVFRDDLDSMTPDELLGYNAELSALRRRVRAEQLRVNEIYSSKVQTEGLARTVGVGTAEGTR